MSSGNIRTAIDWLREKGLMPGAISTVAKADAESKTKHIGFDALVEKLMAKGYDKEAATKIAGKVYWEQQDGGGKGKAKAAKKAD